MTASLRARVTVFEDVLSQEKIDFVKLQNLCFHGIPHESGLRSVCWKIILNYLPVKRKEWPMFLKTQRALYMQFLQELVFHPASAKGPHQTNREDVTFEDHPLNTNPESQWNSYFKDNEVLLQIDKDVRRLYPDMAFFQRPTAFPCHLLLDSTKGIETLRRRIERSSLNAVPVKSLRSGVNNIQHSEQTRKESVTGEELGEVHWEVVERVLFVYAKLNPGIAYVQGMNEIVGPIYYTFASDSQPQCQEHAEADTFFCFTNLMAEIRDNFIKSLDGTQCGIGLHMNRIYSLLHQHDSDLLLHLESQHIEPQFFAFRWLTLLLSQEFLLPDVLRLWDSLLADFHRFDFLIYVCSAMLLLIRDKLLDGDFPTNMKLLQEYPIGDVQAILTKAIELQEKS
uniref:TBC1 domain family member 13 n=1 Tax=Eptatretus burgeri TaxID=7764 RepID=A0A8C4N5B9_EPTBU